MSITDKIADFTEKIVNKDDDGSPVVLPYGEDGQYDEHGMPLKPRKPPAPRLSLDDLR